VLRGGALHDSSMVARRLANHEQVTVASATYLASHGVPQTLEDLAQHRAVNFFSAHTGKFYPFEFKVDGKIRQFDLGGTISVNNADAYFACCRSGFGLIQAPRYGMEAALASGEVQEVLSAYRPEPMAVSVLYPHHRQLSPRVRVFVDWLVEIFAATQ
jgi:LysR family transcriptional regulator for bpeEF and oprC